VIIVVYKARPMQRSSVQIGTNQNHILLAESGNKRNISWR
jgi:hypothetical protein